VAAADEAAINEVVIGEPVRYKNLTIFPVTSKVPNNADLYLTLDEGLKAGTVQVFEVGAEPTAAGIDLPQTNQGSQRRANRAGRAADQPTPFLDQPVAVPGAPPANRRQPERQRAQPSRMPNAANDDPFAAGQQEGAEVNRLMVLNRSAKPLYLMPGEIIYGGQQDRTIGEEAIIPPSKKPVPIQVFCVEHGRWAPREDAETSQALDRLAASSDRPLDAAARRKLAEDAKQGKFVAHAGSLSKGGRVAVQEGKGQQEVWDKVGEANASARVVSGSGAFTANYTSPKVLKQLHAYIEVLQSPVAGRKQVVGAIVAINGKVESVDVFQATPLFQKLWPKLLKSDALDAFAVNREPAAERPCTLSEAREFLRTAMQATVQEKSKTEGGLVVTKRESEKVMSFSAGMGGGMSAGGEGAVHSSGYSK
jgi:hypothetical protein